MSNFNSSIKFLKQIDNSLEHTYHFGSAGEQFNFFDHVSREVAEVNMQTYIRLDKSVKVKLPFDSLIEATYMFFTNVDGGKLYYAFIDRMEYVSTNTTEVFFTIDPLQTYMFDWDLRDNFVEREHVGDDTRGLHLVPENLDVGEVVTPHVRDIPTTLNTIIVVGSTVDLTDYNNPTPEDDFPDITGDLIGGIYQGVALYTFEKANVGLSGGLNEVLDFIALRGKADAIKFMYMQPKCILDTIVDGGLIDKTPTAIFDYVDKTFIADFDGYTPQNQKLFTYPYNFFTVSGGNAREFIYKYEFFEEEIANFCKLQVYGSIGASPVLSVVPRKYKGVEIKFDETISIDNYPYCSWSTDFYQNWLAQNQVSNATAIGGSLLSLGAGIATGQPLAIAGGVLGVTNVIGSFKEASIRPNQPQGSFNGSAQLSNNELGFFVNHKTITREYAEIIDKHLTKFGYKVSITKTPDLTTRTRYNYIKTVDMQVMGDIPADYRRVIEESFDKGLTFWHGDYIGDYTTPNPTV